MMRERNNFYLINNNTRQFQTINNRYHPLGELEDLLALIRPDGMLLLAAALYNTTPRHQEVLRQPLVATQASLFQPPKICKELIDFIEGRNRAPHKNMILSEEFHLDPEKLHLMCPISRDFPEIPVNLKGQLFDYNSLKPLIIQGYIKHPFTREDIAVNNIQPDLNSQARMDELLHQQVPNHSSIHY